MGNSLEYSERDGARERDKSVHEDYLDFNFFVLGPVR